MSLYDELSRAARKILLDQIGITDRLIRQLYIRASRALAERIRNAKAGSLTERWLIAYRAELEREIERLGRGVYQAVVEGAQKAAEARVECDAEYLRRAAALAGIDDSFVATLSSVPTDALRAMIDGKLYTDGRMLSQRIWSATGRLEGNISEMIQQAVAQKMDALTLAGHLEAYVNPKAACPVSWHRLYPDIPFDRKVDYNALRLARTAITHTQWAAGKAAARKNPLCTGMKWSLSNQHYERQIEPWGEDVCDEYARHDEGLGKGVWPIESLPMPHPNCLCYQTEVVPTLEDAAELLAESLKRAERGETQSGSLEDAFRQWQKENSQEILNWYTQEEALKRQLDNSAEFATMDTAQIAKAMLSEPMIPDAKIYQYLLKPGTNHNRDFVEAGYVSEADGERLRRDIIQKCKEESTFDTVEPDWEHGGIRFRKYITLGPENHRFRIVWKVDEGAQAPRLVTAFRKEN